MGLPIFRVSRCLSFLCEILLRHGPGLSSTLCPPCISFCFPLCFPVCFVLVPPNSSVRCFQNINLALCPISCFVSHNAIPMKPTLVHIKWSKLIVQFCGFGSTQQVGLPQLGIKLALTSFDRNGTQKAYPFQAKMAETSNVLKPKKQLHLKPFLTSVENMEKDACNFPNQNCLQEFEVFYSLDSRSGCLFFIFEPSLAIRNGLLRLNIFFLRAFSKMI